MTRGPERSAFYAALRQGIQRACNKSSPREVAFVTDLSKKQLGNVLTGSETNAKTPWDLLTIDPSALDDIAALYGVEVVPAQPDIEHGELLAVLADLVASLAACPKPTHQDLLRLEPKLREGAASLKTMIARCRSLRRAS